MDDKAKIIFLNAENVEDKSQSAGSAKKRGLSIKRDSNIFEISALAGGGQLTKVLQKFTTSDAGGSNVRERGEETSTKSTVLLATVSSVDVATVRYLTMDQTFTGTSEMGSKLTLLRVGKDLVVMSGDMVLWRIGGFFDLGSAHGGLGLKKMDLVNKLLAKHIMAEKALRDDLYALSDPSVNGTPQDLDIQSKEFNQLVLELTKFIQFKPGYGFFTPSITYGNGTIRGIVDYSNVPGLGHVYVDLANNIGYKYDLFGNFVGVDNLTGIVDVIGSRGNDTIHGNAEGNYLYGFIGSDTFIGSGGNDYMVGGAGGQNVVTYDTHDVHHIVANLSAGIVGKLDYLGNQLGSDTLVNIQKIVGGIGNDYFMMGSAFPAIGTIDGLTGFNILDGTSAINPLIFNLKADTVSVGATQVLKFMNIQQIIGGAGDDTFLGAANETMTIDGGLGSNTLSYGQDSSITNVTIDLGTNVATKLSGSSVTNDYFLNMQGFVGSQGSDYFKAAIGNHHLDGQDGFNIVDYSLSPSIDYIHADLRSGVIQMYDLVTVLGSDNHTTIEGVLTGSDVIENFQRVIGGLTGDNIFYSPENGYVEFIGGAGNDTFFGNTGSGEFAGGGGLNLIDFSALPSNYHVTVNFSQGTAFIYDEFNNLVGQDSFSNIQAIKGTSNDDVIIGDPSSITIDGQPGFNQISYDSIAGVDHVIVNIEQNRVRKFDSNDTLTGTDTLIGVQKVSGTTGADTFLLNTTQGAINQINGLGGIDTLNASALVGLVLFYDLLTGQVIDNDTSSVLMSFENIENFIGNDTESYFKGVLTGDYTLQGSTAAAPFNFVEYSNDPAIDFAVVDLASGTAMKYDSSGNLRGTDTLVNIRNVVARSGNQLIIGDDNDNRIGLANGHYTVMGSMGDDIINNEGGATVLLDYSNLNHSVQFLGVDFALNTIYKTTGFSGSVLGSDTITGINTVKGISTGTNFFAMTIGDFTVIGGSGADNVVAYQGIPSVDHVIVDLYGGIAQKFDSSNESLGTDTIQNINSAWLAGVDGLVVGSNSSDIISISGGDLSLIGSLGSDVISMSGSSSVAVNYSGNPSNAAIDHITVNLSSAPTIEKYNTFNNLLGTDLFNKLNSIHGTSGDDAFMVVNNTTVGIFTIDGGGGANTLDFSGINFGLNVDLYNGNYLLTSISGATFTNIQEFKAGSAATNFFDAAGDFTFIGNNLTYVKTTNSDIDHSTVDLSLGTLSKYDATGHLMGMDSLIGIDNIEVGGGNGGANYVIGNNNNNTIIAHIGASTLIASLGNDSYVSNSFANAILDYGQSNFDNIYANLSNNTVTKFSSLMGTSTDTINGIPTVLGTSGDDYFVTGTVAGGGTVIGDLGTQLTRFVGNGGIDTLDASDYNNTSLVLTFNLTNGSFNDSIGRNVYFADIDVFHGAASGHNLFYGAVGSYSLDGVSSSTLNYSLDSNIDYVAVDVNAGLVAKYYENGSLAGIDTYNGFTNFFGANGSGQNVFYGGSPDVTFIGVGSSDNIVDYSSSSLNHISVNSFGTVYKYDTSGTHTDFISNILGIRGTSGNDIFSLSGSAADIQTVLGSNGNDSIWGRAGVLVDYSDSNIHHIVYDSATNTVHKYGDALETVSLSNGVDSLSDVNTIFGAAGNDVFNVNGFGSDLITNFFGVGGNDTMNLLTNNLELDMNVIHLSNISNINMASSTGSESVIINGTSVLNNMGPSLHGLTIMGGVNDHVNFQLDGGWSFVGSTVSGGTYDIYQKTIGAEIATVNVQHQVNVII